MSTRRDGALLPKNGGNSTLRDRGSPVHSSGPVSTTAVSRHRTAGPASIPILEFSTCAASRKITSTIIRHGGPIKPYFISRLTGTGKAKKVSRLTFGARAIAIVSNYSSTEHLSEGK